MCDVCNSEGINWKYVNGHKDQLHQVKLYRVYRDKLASIKLCHLHGIELFVLGERRFLENHMPLTRMLAEKKGSFAA